jgi:anti-sigma regulatory factor (Ser/Thr protein kinase)
MAAQPSTHNLELRNDLSELERMSVWIHVIGKLMELPDAILSDLDLCAAEAVHNVIAYAYEDSSLHRIQVRLSRGPTQVSLEVEDDGTPFNPLEYPPAPSVSRLEQAPLGGRGIHLIRGLMTECGYRRHDGRNILTLARAF